MTCYAATLALGRHPGPGAADDLWTHYEEVLDLVPGLGFDGVRLNVEWARLEPRRGEVDERAVARYREVLTHARQLGLDVTLVVIDRVWPSWLGLEAWLLPWVVPEVIAHARRVVETYGELVTGVVAFTRAEELVAGGYLRGSSPPWRTSAIEDANFANAQIESILSRLRADEVVGARLVRSSAEVTLEHGPDGVAAARASLDVDELYVRSLLRGAGPTALTEGLLVQHGDQWRVHASEELRSALR